MPNMNALCLMVRKLCAKLVFQMQVKGHNQGHMNKIYGTIRKVLSKGTHMSNMKTLSHKVKKL